MLRGTGIKGYVVTILKMCSLADKHILKCTIPMYMAWNLHCLETTVCPSLQDPLCQQRSSKFTGQSAGQVLSLDRGLGTTSCLHIQGPVSAHTMPLQSTPCPSVTGWVSWVEVGWAGSEGRLSRCKQREVALPGWSAGVTWSDIFMSDRPSWQRCGRWLWEAEAI